MLRAIAERLSRAPTLRYRLQQIYGGCRMIVPPEASLRYWLLGRGVRVDESLLRYAAETIKPDSVIWEVGVRKNSEQY